MHKVFVYGTLKKGFKLHHHLENAKFLGEGFIWGYDLYNVGWYPAAIKGTGKIFGELYEMDDETLKLLDQVEDEGFLYKRIEDEVFLKDKKIKAFVYIYLHDTRNLEKIESGVFENGKG